MAAPCICTVLCSLHVPPPDLLYFRAGWGSSPGWMTLGKPPEHLLPHL